MFNTINVPDFIKYLQFILIYTKYMNKYIKSNDFAILLSYFLLVSDSEPYYPILVMCITAMGSFTVFSSVIFSERE